MKKPELAKKEKILKAAREVFVEKGYDGARMQEIANRARVNKALLHYYFTSKDNLYHEIITSTFSTLLSDLSMLFEKDLPLEQQIQQFVERHVDFISRNSDLLKLLFYELIRGDFPVHQSLAELIKHDFQLPKKVINLFQEAMEEGTIRQHDPVQTILSVLSMNIFYFLFAPVFKNIIPVTIQDDAKFIEERKQAIIDLVLYGIKK